MSGIQTLLTFCERCQLPTKAGSARVSVPTQPKHQTSNTFPTHRFPPQESNAYITRFASHDHILLGNPLDAASRLPISAVDLVLERHLDSRAIISYV